MDENNGGDAGYDWERARTAEIWMQNFLNEPHTAPPTEGFTDSAVEQALNRMHQGASGLDGTSEMDPPSGHGADSYHDCSLQLCLLARCNALSMVFGSHCVA